MGSTGEPDQKRRQVSSLSPTGATATKKQPLFPCASSSEDKKLDFAVLQYQNQKLTQQLEVQKVEYSSLENRFHQLKEKHKAYDDTLEVVNKSWDRLVDDLETLSVCTSGAKHDGDSDLRGSDVADDGASCPLEDEFLGRLMETGATDSCMDSVIGNDIRARQETTRSVLQNILSLINGIWQRNNEIADNLLLALSKDELSKQLWKMTKDLQVEVRNFRVAMSDLHLNHRLVVRKVRNHRDTYARNKAEHKRLAEELLSAVKEMEESNGKLAILKAQGSRAQGAPLLFPNLGNKHVGGDKASDKQKELQDMESALKEMEDVLSSRLVEIQILHERRIEVLNMLANLQNMLMDTNRITSSNTYLLLLSQLEKSKSEVDQCQASLEKLQVERDNFLWREREMSMKVDFVDVSQRILAFSDSRIAELEQKLKDLTAKRIDLEAKIEEASKEPGRKEIISEFKALITTLPKDTGIMQSQLSQHKEAATDLHFLRAEVQSLSDILQRKEKELESLSGRSIQQLSEIKKLQEMVQDLKESDLGLKLILDMYRRESPDTSDVIDSRDMEFKAWAHVQSLKSSLDEHKLELRVKAANEAEAISQQKLATAEAEIAELRQKLELSERDMRKLSDILKLKHEEAEAYLSEIESIGQAYEDMQTQNQHLLQQITERDDYNIKLVLEGVRARQLQDALLSEIQGMSREIQAANLFIDLNKTKVAHLEDQLKIWAEQVGRLMGDCRQDSIFLESAQKKLLDVQKESQQLRQSLDQMQPKAQKSQLEVAELLMEIEKERFNKKRLEEELEALTRKAESLRAKTGGSSVIEKLKHELREYRGILKCDICHERQKEVVIAKCYHLFCSLCVQRTVESRHRKCPTCNMSFGPNDVKPIYI